MLAGVVVVLDECADLSLQVARQGVVFQQNSVLQGTMPTLDLTLALGMMGCAAEVLHLLLTQPVSADSLTLIFLRFRP